MASSDESGRKLLQLPTFRKRDMDEEGTVDEFILRLGDGKEYLITERMWKDHPYLKDPEARLTRNFEDIYLILCGYSIQHLSEELFKDKARLSVFRTNALDFDIKLTDEDILLIQKDEHDELKVICDYVRSKGSGWGNKIAAFSQRREVRSFLTDLRDSFSNLFEKISPDHILDLLEAGKAKELVIKNWSSAMENSVLLFVKKFTERFFR
jgi:hypothetical protein